MLRSLVLFLALAGPLAAAEKPNIVVLLIDDMGWGDFSCFGNQEAKTPNIDRLASEGIRFKQFYVNQSICSPSRCAIATGQYPQRWNITSFLENRQSNKRRGMAQWLDLKAPTLARSLKGAGYATGHFGKWHLGGQRDVADAPLITEYGYDKSLTNFEGMGPKLLPLTMRPNDKEPKKIWQDAERLGGPVTWMQRSQITTGYIDAALPFMDQAVKDKKPFYVDVWPDDVHSPFWPPVDKWEQGKRGMYLAVLKEMDRQLGKLFDHIRDTPELKDNTIVLVFSDNGPEPGAGSAGPFRGKKGSLYEGGTRSPLIVWSPSLVEKAKVGTVNESSVFAAFDLAPSLLTIAKVDGGKTTAYDGEDLSATMLGKADASRKAPIFWRRPPDRKNIEGAVQPDLAVREGSLKLLCSYDGSDTQLYDLAADPGEAKNLAAGQKETAERLAKMAVTWHQSMPQDRGPELGAKAEGKEADE
ncbi:sulfatase-like hydrolase/transferase [Haloferula sp. BvORR071]|uniref:sulfatase-like hydrolase/transferase n=1 Tax=Haloferula sp. BvORR071 TaxID=1396141 RepID=UPI00055750AE